MKAELQSKYGSKGFSVLAFPIKDFNQELGSNEEILSFMDENFPQVDFPLFSLNSLKENPVYHKLHKQKPDNHIKWNFYKFLIDWNGQVVEFYDKKVNPMQISGQIEQLLDEASKIGGAGQKLVTS
jgi:glutathione peroxidase